MHVKFSKFPNTTPKCTVPEHTICQLAIHFQDPELSRNAFALSNGSGSFFGRQHPTAHQRHSTADLDYQKIIIDVKTDEVPVGTMPATPISATVRLPSHPTYRCADPGRNVGGEDAPSPRAYPIQDMLCGSTRGGRCLQMQVRWKAGLQ
jgi:hypothetical protein